jgi:hypothetical protein
MIAVYDDLVPVETQIALETIMGGPDFYWLLFPGEANSSVGDVKDSNYFILEGDLRVREYAMFGHNFLYNGGLTSNTAKLVYTMFQDFCRSAGIKQERISRIKANLQTQCNFSKEYFFNTPHIDSLEPHTVGIYYVNDSDGDTTLFDNEGNVVKTVSPKQGRFLVFDGKYFHAGRHPILANKRIVINFNF